MLLVDERDIAEESNLSQAVTPDSPAYVLFTSGSSGIPKAVVVPHRAITRLVFGLSEIGLNSSEVVFHFAPLNFDASTFEIWGALLQGAKIAIHCDDIVDMPALGETLTRHRVTTAWLTSSLFNEIIDRNPAILRGVRKLITGGEALSPWTHWPRSRTASGDAFVQRIWSYRDDDFCDALCDSEAVSESRDDRADRSTDCRHGDFGVLVRCPG